MGLTPDMPPHWRLLKARLEELCPKSLWITSWNRTNPADATPFLLQVPVPPSSRRSTFEVPLDEVSVSGRGRPDKCCQS